MSAWGAQRTIEAEALARQGRRYLYSIYMAVFECVELAAPRCSRKQADDEAIRVEDRGPAVSHGAV